MSMAWNPGELSSPVIRLCAAAGLVALSGFPGLLLAGRPGAGQRVAAALTAAGSLLGIFTAAGLLLSPSAEAREASWNLPFGPCEVAADPLSALFLLPVFLVSACGAVYALDYVPGARHRSTEPAMTLFHGLLAGSMAFLLLSRNGVLFLAAWEVMAMSGWFLLVTDHRDPEVRKAGLVYLVATHAGTVGLFILFAKLRAATGSFVFPPLHSLDPAAGGAALFAAALVGFCSKSGLMPFHVWLPSAHANAPSHVSALLSGVMLKMGVYGVLRTVFLFRTPPFLWGAVLLALGAASMVLGIVFAAAQRDLKRMLACSSIENVGIVYLGVGAGVCAAASGNGPAALLCLAGALLHALNHSLFKPLLFLCAGSVLHAAGTREIDRMGGLAKRIPRTAALFLAGAVAICGLPPMNGFAGEFLLYFAFLSEARSAAVPWMATLAPLLALAGGVAAACFVKAYGIAFLGSPRTAEPPHGGEAGRAMLLPMGLLAALCLLFGVFPQPLVRLAESAAGTLLPHPVPAGWSAAARVPLAFLGGTWAALGGAALLAGLLWRRRTRALPSAADETWGCGYLAPSPRMQYTGVSFSGMLAGLFGGAVRPAEERPSVPGPAPAPSRFRHAPTETLLDRGILPALSLVAAFFSFLRLVQHGRMNVYMLYIFVTLFLLMAWGVT
jgi:hydrogenase-4 component B